MMIRSEIECKWYTEPNDRLKRVYGDEGGLSALSMWMNEWMMNENGTILYDNYSSENNNNKKKRNRNHHNYSFCFSFLANVFGSKKNTQPSNDKYKNFLHLKISLNFRFFYAIWQ